MADLREEFRRLCYAITFKVFSSGSQGFYQQRKFVMADGNRYQAQVTAVLIGSKNSLTTALHASRDDLAFEAQALLENLEAKTFRTGRVGYYASGKVTIGEERFQVGMQAVRIRDA